MAFEGKTAVITGGLGGIGWATAICLLENGISVCINSKKKVISNISNVIVYKFWINPKRE